MVVAVVVAGGRQLNNKDLEEITEATIQTTAAIPITTLTNKSTMTLTTTSTTKSMSQTKTATRAATTMEMGDAIL